MYPFVRTYIQTNQLNPFRASLGVHITNVLLDRTRRSNYTACYVYINSVRHPATTADNNNWVRNMSIYSTKTKHAPGGPLPSLRPRALTRKRRLKATRKHLVQHSSFPVRAISVGRRSSLACDGVVPKERRPRQRSMPTHATCVGVNTALTDRQSATGHSRPTNAASRRRWY